MRGEERAALHPLHQELHHGVRDGRAVEGGGACARAVLVSGKPLLDQRPIASPWGLFQDKTRHTKKRTAAELVQDDEGARGGVLQDVGALRELHEAAVWCRGV